MATDDDAHLGAIERIQVAVHELPGGQVGIVEAPVGLRVAVVLFAVTLVRHLPGVQVLEDIAERELELGAAQRDQHQPVVVGNEPLGMSLLVKQKVHILGVAPATGGFGPVARGVVGHHFQAFGIGHLLIQQMMLLGGFGLPGFARLELGRLDATRQSFAQHMSDTAA